MKLLLERTEDRAFLRSVVTHPRCWPWVGEGDASDYEPLIHPDIHYLAWDDGFFAFKRVHGGLYEVHAFAPGAVTPEHGKAALQWMASFTDAVKVFSLIPAHKRHAVKFAQSVGFSVDGRLSGAYEHRGRMKDMILMGVTLWAAQ